MTRRKAIPKAVKAEVLRRSAGLCEAEGCTEAGKELDHVLPVALGGSNEAENLQLLCRLHHKAKTGTDVGRIRKADRQARRTGRQREGKRKHIWPNRPLNGTKASGWRKKMSGEVEKR